MKINDFKNDLKFSHEAEDLSIWGEIYNKAFPECFYKNAREDGELQRVGIDRTIVLKSGKAIYIDEKVRRVDYGDIALEYISNDKFRTLGWVEKPLFCDYIAYAILPAKKCYLLPVPQLQKAWADNKQIWLDRFKTISAKHIKDNILSCTVSIPVLFKAIGSSLRMIHQIFSPWSCH